MKYSVLLCIICCCFGHKRPYRPTNRHLTVVHEWVTLQYDFSSRFERFLKEHGLLIPENNILINIDVNGKDVFVTVDRFARDGVPSSLNKVIKRNGKSLLQPFPSLQKNQIGDCNAIQSAISIEVDPTTNLIWVLDEGIVNKKRLCPRKLVIFDIKTRKEVFRHVYPEWVVSKSSRLFDLVLDKEHSTTRFAYIVDSIDSRLIVVDIVQNSSWFFKHSSMEAEEGKGEITVNNETIRSKGGINGIAMTANRRFVYYLGIASFRTWQVPTFVIRNGNNDTFDKFVRMIGYRPGHAVGLAAGSDSLFISDLETKAMLKWNRRQDIILDKREEYVLLRSVDVLVRDDRLFFVVSNDVDSGYMWYSSSNLHKANLGTIDFSGNDGPNFAIGKIFVGENHNLLGPKDSYNKKSFKRRYN